MYILSVIIQINHLVQMDEVNYYKFKRFLHFEIVEWDYFN